MNIEKRPFILKSLIAFMGLLALPNCTHTEPIAQTEKTPLIQRDVAAVRKLPAAQMTNKDVVYPWPFSKTLIGTSHANPLYDPSGLLSEHVLSNGALDARLMGFSVFKIWVGPEVYNSTFYRFDSKVLNPKPTLDQMAQLPEYQRTLSLPFDVFVIEFDTPEMWATPSNRSLTAADVQNIDQQTYALASTFLKNYAGTGKVFIIQNHEGDNHLADFGNPQIKFPNPNYVPPTPVAYENYRVYFQTRQAAIRRARKDFGAVNVALYHMCEINSVIRITRPDLLKDQTKAAEAVGQKLVTTGLVTEALPFLDCDLYGYSSYDSAFFKDPQIMKQSIEFIKSHTRPSLAFGRDNVAISEVGIPDRDTYMRDQVMPDFKKNSRRWIQDLKLPFFLVWQLYDNECATGDCKNDGPPYKNIETKQARGFWMRTVSGRYSEYFKSLQDLTEAQVPLEEVPQWAYHLLLGRAPTSSETQSSIDILRKSGREEFYLSLTNHPEAREKLVTDVFQNVLKKSPRPEQLQFWRQVIQPYALAQAANLLVLQGSGLENINKRPVYPIDLDPSLSPAQRNRKKFILNLFEKLLHRTPQAQELDEWMKSSGNCVSVALKISTGREFLSQTQTMDNMTFVKNLYTSLLQREGDAGGVNGWTQGLNGGHKTRADVAKGFAESEEMKGRCSKVYEVP